MPQHTAILTSAKPSALHTVLSSINNAKQRCHRPDVRLVAVSKTRDAAAIAAMAQQGQRVFGENYVQEAQPKIAALRSLQLEWHLIGHLQSNKAELAATLFDWVQSVDRVKLVHALARHRPTASPPLNVLIQVNIDDENSKSGCNPSDIPALAEAISTHTNLCLRGLMAIPAPAPSMQQRRAAFAAMTELFQQLKLHYPAIDTLSMGMSEDFVEAIEEGATLVRVGSALFGARPAKQGT